MSASQGWSADSTRFGRRAKWQTVQAAGVLSNALTTAGCQTAFVRVIDRREHPETGGRVIELICLIPTALIRLGKDRGSERDCPGA